MVQNLRINKDEFTEEQINQLIEDNNVTIKLTNKRKKLLAVLLHLNGLDDKDEQGRFFIDNLWLSNFVGMTETNMLIALRYLQRNGIIERESGSNHNCSRYKIINSTNQKTVVQNNSIDDKNNSTNNSIDDKNNSRDRDIELDIDKELDIEKEKDIYNIIINKINNIIKEKENNIINIIKEKEKDTLMEETLKQQINQLKEQNNQLQQQNEILTARLNNAAKQFKIMNNTMRELQQKKESKTSTAFCGDAVEDVKEVKKETPTVEGRKDKEQIKTTNVEVKPSTAFCNEAVEGKKELSPIEEDINETFDIEQIVGFFKKEYTNPQAARQRENELLKEYKAARLSFYKRRDLELRLNKYIKSLEIINSTVQEELQELPQEAAKEVEEAIVSRKEDKATEEKESTFVETFQEVKSDCVVCEERLRYQDLKSKIYYSSIDEAKAAEVNPMYLYDYEISRCVSSFN